MPLALGAVFMSLAVSLLLVLISPDRFVEATIQGDYFREETAQQLSLDSKLFLLHPEFRLRRLVEAIDWIETASITQTLPNHVSITYRIKTPLACSESVLYFGTSTLAITNATRVLCEDRVLLLGPGDASIILRSLSSIPEELRDLIQRIDFEDDRATVYLKNGASAIVYPNDLTVLHSISTLAPTSQARDLRRNYA
jgi:cell division septal protein FtsQ